MKKVMVFDPKPDITAYELARVLVIRLECDPHGEFWQGVLDDARRHFVLGIREEEEEDEAR